MKSLFAITIAVMLVILGCDGNLPKLNKELKEDVANSSIAGAAQNGYEMAYKVKPLKIVYVNYKFLNKTEIKSEAGVKQKAYPFLIEGEGYFSYGGFKKWTKIEADGYLFQDEFGENKIRLKTVKRKEWPMKGTLAQDMEKRFGATYTENGPTFFKEM